MRFSNLGVSQTMSLSQDHAHLSRILVFQHSSVTFQFFTKCPKQAEN